MTKGESSIIASDYKVINASGYLNSRSGESLELKEVLKRAGESGSHNNYIINLAEVEYLDSSTMGMFVRFLYQLQAAEKRLILLAPTKSVENVLLMTGLHELMPFARSEEEACRLLDVKPRRLAGKSEDVDYDQLEKELEDLIICSPDTGNLKESPEIQKIMGK